METIRSFAKINIFLEITGKSGNFHKLHSLLCRVNLCDEITITPSKTLEITYSTPIQGDIILKTVNILTKYFSNLNTSFHFQICKNIPMQAGLGGGSSNGAEAMKFLLKANNISLKTSKMLEIGEKIGADVPFFLQAKPAILNGIGAELFSVNFKIPPLWCVLVMPNFGISTSDAFAKFSQNFTKFRAITSFEDAIMRENALQVSANLIRNGKINAVLNQIFHSKAFATKMSGSGSCCFVLFKAKSDAKKHQQSLKNQGFTAFLTQIQP